MTYEASPATVQAALLEVATLIKTKSSVIRIFDAALLAERAHQDVTPNHFGTNRLANMYDIKQTGAQILTVACTRTDEQAPERAGIIAKIATLANQAIINWPPTQESVVQITALTDELQSIGY